MANRKDYSLVALLTDFGSNDWFVGTMKGVIKRISPAIDIVDICHSIEPHSVIQGAIALWSAYRYFPYQTVFCCIVDPGVGGQRQPIVAQDDHYFYVAPNNGLLTLVAGEAAEWQCRIIENPQYMLPQISTTFHGRDIFAPAAAHLAINKEVESFGPKLQNFLTIDFPKVVSPKKRQLQGQVVSIDNFGNLVTNFRFEDLPRGEISGLIIQLQDRVIKGIKKCFSDVEQGQPVAYWGSSGLLEIAVNRGRADELLSATIGTDVIIKLP